MILNRVFRSCFLLVQSIGGSFLFTQERWPTRDGHGGDRKAARQRWIDFQLGRRFGGNGAQRVPSNLISGGSCECDYKAGELQGSHSFPQTPRRGPNDLPMILQYGVNRSFSVQPPQLRRTV